MYLLYHTRVQPRKHGCARTTYEVFGQPVWCCERMTWAWDHLIRLSRRAARGEEQPHIEFVTNFYFSSGDVASSSTPICGCPWCLEPFDIEEIEKVSE